MSRLASRMSQGVLSPLKTLVSVIRGKENEKVALEFAGEMRPPSQRVLSAGSRAQRELAMQLAERKARYEQKASSRLPASQQGASGGAVAAPATRSMVVPSFYVRAAGSAQRLTDQSGSKGTENSLRVVGSDQVLTISTGADASKVINGSAYSISISPVRLGARLQGMSKCYQWYAIREIRFTYVPSCGTSTPGLIALGYTQNYDTQLDAVIDTTGEVMQLSPALMGPVWNPLSFTMKFAGTKLWTTSAISAAPRDWIQGLLYGVGTGTAPSTSYGVICMQYVIDLYGSAPPVSTPSLDDPSPEEKKHPEKERELPLQAARPPLIREDYGAAHASLSTMVEPVRTPVSVSGAAPPSAGPSVSAFRR